MPDFGSLRRAREGGRGLSSSQGGNRIRLPRMTIRRWMAAVSLVAILAAALIEVEKARKLQSQYASALRAFQASSAYYKEGRTTLEKCVASSQHVMEAQLALCVTKGKQDDAINAHLNRASALIYEEINLP